MKSAFTRSAVTEVQPTCGSHFEVEASRMPPLAEAVLVWHWILGQFAGQWDGEMRVLSREALAHESAVLD
jgi:hypothetical protein